jgi:hypothetical protein
VSISDNYETCLKDIFHQALMKITGWEILLLVHSKQNTEYEYLMDIVSDSVLKAKVSCYLFFKFLGQLDWRSEISEYVIRKLLFESRFLWYSMKKTEYRNELDPDTYLRLPLSPIVPDLKFMCSSRQPYPSH